MPRIVGGGGLHAALPDVSANQHHAQVHAPTDHTATIQTAQLAADVTIAAPGTYVDGPSMSLVAGTYIITGGITINGDSNDQVASAKLWDGATVYDSASQMTAAAGASTKGTSISLSHVITLGGTTTVKISATVASGGAASKILAATPSNGSGNNASFIRAAKLGN